jgi:hypothetical protein
MTGREPAAGRTGSWLAQLPGAAAWQPGRPLS